MVRSWILGAVPISLRDAPVSSWRNLEKSQRKSSSLCRWRDDLRGIRYLVASLGIAGHN